MEQNGDIKSGVCKICGQTQMLTEELRERYPNVTDVDELASLDCDCESGRKWREAKQQEFINTRFIAYAETELAAFVREREFKRLVVQDAHGNTAALFRTEKGDIKIKSTLSKLI